MEPKYPAVTVQLTGMDGNGFFIVTRVSAALRAAKVPQEDISAYVSECMDGDYDHLLQTTMRTVTVA